MKDFYEWIFSSTYRVRRAYTVTSHTPAQFLFSLSYSLYVNCVEIHAPTGLTSETRRIFLISFTTG